MSTDELELAWDDDTDKGRHRRRARRGGRGRAEGGGSPARRRGGRTAIALLVTLVIFGLVGGGLWYGFNKVGDFFAAPDYNSGGSGEIVVEIKKNWTAREIGLELENQGVVKSQKAFVQAADDDERSRGIQPGFYRLRKEMRAADALGLLLDRGASRVVSRLVVPEGKTAKEVLDLAAKATGLPLADFEAAAKDPVALGIPDWWFNRQDKKPSVKGVEGFLFPSTYEFNPNMTAAQVLKQMVAQFMTVTTRLNFVERVQNERKISPYEALIVASLAQAEAGIAEDLPRVAKVAYNRVFQANMPLQFDVTANYWLQLQGKAPKHSGQLTPAELDDPKNPYNTVSVRGLPVGPIGNPGEAALTGAMDPPNEKWLYFVAIDKSGRSAFAATLAEHERNTRTACANGVALC